MPTCQNHGWYNSQQECPACRDPIGVGQWHARGAKDALSQDYGNSHKLCTYIQCPHCHMVPMVLREAIVEIRDSLAKRAC